MGEGSTVAEASTQSIKALTRVKCITFTSKVLRTAITMKKIRGQPNIDFADETLVTVVKEFRSKMFGQHPGYFKAVFLKKTQIIIVSIYEYTVYIMF
jgi:hypothetical protein